MFSAPFPEDGTGCVLRPDKEDPGLNSEFAVGGRCSKGLGARLPASSTRAAEGGLLMVYCGRDTVGLIGLDRSPFLKAVIICGVDRPDTVGEFACVLKFVEIFFEIVRGGSIRKRSAKSE